MRGPDVSTSSAKPARTTTAALAERVDFVEDAILRLIRNSQDQAARLEGAAELLTELHRTVMAQGALITALGDVVAPLNKPTKLRPRQCRQLPEGWSVVQGGAERGTHPVRTPGGEQRPALTVVAS